MITHVNKVSTFEATVNLQMFNKIENGRIMESYLNIEGKPETSTVLFRDGIFPSLIGEIYFYQDN